MVELANVGDSPAIITELRASFRAFLPGRDAPWKMLKLMDMNRVHTADDHKIGNGDSLALLVNADDILEDAIAANTAVGTIFTIFCLGYVEYTDDMGKHRRRTGFIRVANNDEQRFTRVDDPDFEYQD